MQAHEDRALTAAQSARHGSPWMMPITNTPIPPQSIWVAAFIHGDAVFGTCFEYNEPPAQQMPATITPMRRR